MRESYQTLKNPPNSAQFAIRHLQGRIAVEAPRPWPRGLGDIGKPEPRSKYFAPPA